MAEYFDHLVRQADVERMMRHLCAAVPFCCSQLGGVAVISGEPSSSAKKPTSRESENDQG
ncbi:MAG: hypothetical protein LKE51_04935 [Selenomonas sp.]|nr:hypothetical protein [Selenomonas sp.]